ncbi:hypothetical protein D3C84_662520 [compost metagenome]
MWRLADHQFRRAEYLPGLLLCGRSRVHLGAELTVGNEHADANTARNHGFAVLARYFPVAFAEPPVPALLLNPTKGDGEAEQLPRFQGDELTFEGPLTFGMGQQLDQL